MNPSSSSMLTTAESVTSGLSSMSAAATAQSMITTTGVVNENVEEEEEGLNGYESEKLVTIALSLFRFGLRPRLWPDESGPEFLLHRNESPTDSSAAE